MLDPFQALAWFAEVHVPEADTSNLRARAEALRDLAGSIGKVAARTEAAVAEARTKNDSRAVDRFADVWPYELAPRYAALQEELHELADGCDDYSDAVDKHRDQLWIIGTQLAALAFTMMFGFIYPAARFAAQRAFNMLVARAKLERTLFQKITKMILEQRMGKRRVGTYLVREGLDALADSVTWAVLKTGVHAASSAATGQPMGNLFEYAGKHFAAEFAYNGGIKALSDVRRFFPATKVTETLLGAGSAGRFFRRTLSASTIYPLVISGELSAAGALRSAMAHAPRAFIFKR
ncbi:WXG100-like domain-containing protein [Nonomuraea sp. KM88]|uniref:WXG100-like domain-containing protein n=1 Tax=Nonomuraea sp. KM88 TaxID=3457427 RepID=UPI003FCDFED7